jgi:hypothetical protein
MMSETHLEERELARLSDREVIDVEVIDHLRWCARCRNVAAEYDWLQEEVATTLGTVAEAVPIPRPTWRGISSGLHTDRQRVMVRRRLSAAMGVAMACLLIIGPSVLGGGVAIQSTLSPDVMTAPMPITAAVATPILHRSEKDTALTLAPTLAPLPTPHPETQNPKLTTQNPKLETQNE